MSDSGTADEIKALIELSKNVMATKTRLDQILSSMPVAFVIVNDDGTIEASTEQFRKLTGWKAEEVVGDNLAQYLVDTAGSVEFANPIEEPRPTKLKLKNGSSVTVLMKSGELNLDCGSNFCFCFMELI